MMCSIEHMASTREYFPAAFEAERSKLVWQCGARSQRFMIPSLRSSSDAADAHVLQNDVVVESVVRTLASEARLLYSAERSDLIRNKSGVDADHAVLQLLRNTPDAVHIPAIEVSGEAKFRVVR